MSFVELERVVLERDLPEHGLRKGDVGTVVDVHTTDAALVEFVLPTGDTLALLDLTTNDVRKVTPADILTVRAR
jgi:hypothetical protein